MIIPRESSEYLTVTVTADVDLDDQDVEVSLVGYSSRPSTWLPAVWAGSVGTTRQAQVAPGWADALSAGIYTVYVRVTDTPEVPVINAGTVTLN